MFILCSFFIYIPQELETIEEQWHSETKELMELVNRLQEENRRIKQSEYKNVNDNMSDGKQVPKPEQNMSNLLNESDFQKLKRLRGQMEKQRDELMCRDQEIEEKNTEIENVMPLLWVRSRHKVSVVFSTRCNVKNG